jgi:DNA polymerase-3 subunit chi
MMQVLCYRVSEEKRHKSMCKLLETIVSRGMNAMLLVPSDDALTYWDALLWTYEQLSFLPHVVMSDRLASSTPLVLASTVASPPNKAKVLVCSDTITVPKDFAEGFEKLVYMYSDEKEMEDVLVQLDANLQVEVVRYQLSESGQWQKLN